MPLARDRCICLRKTDYSETSQILSLLGRDCGIVRVIAKGAHRKTKAGASKFDGGVDLLDVGDAVFTHASERDLGTLCEWSLREGNRPLRNELRSIYLGLYAGELLHTMLEEHDPHPELFDRLERLLTDLATTRREEIFLAFQLDMLREAGFVPEMGSCVDCGSPTGASDRAYFAASRGGVVCRNCEQSSPDRVEIDARLLRLIQSVLRLPRVNGWPQRLPHLSRHQTDPINRLLADHVEHTLSRRLRMTDYVV